MEPVLDESSLLPCGTWTPGSRLSLLAASLRALDRLGLARVLRSVRDAADRDLSGGHGFRFWCFHRDVDKDVGRFVAQRLGKQPFIDGADGLFAAAEGPRLLETKANGVLVFGLGLAAVEEHVAVALGSAARPKGHTVQIELLESDGEEDQSAVVDVTVAILEQDVEERKGEILAGVDRSVTNGEVLLERHAELFPQLLFGPQAEDQVRALSGSEPIFRQVLRHLRALNAAAEEWHPGNVFEPKGITFSNESKQTLSHGHYGPMRDFAPPEGHAAFRWSSHTKLTGGAGARMYFEVTSANARATVLIGYLGRHLPGVKF